ncbi:hypothetical protein SAMN04488034_101273 [Salinimicrobium catena]|uniref:Uncharacterized protein n=1 Tax=Salinimicrobium catena TaxID=390640 RepID=A0A1H5HXT2_9FLAO|nr:hypothetical protein [Salinimicrobium catena]SDK73596.1 hypothetical protein SAMN04488140_101273 [Salinimicrobium catena]SEE32719.1 hypothetical protein SAMN04488034_101273 [Salinimicrobium catena]
MYRLVKGLKHLFFPVTLMTLVTILGIILSVQAVYVALTNDHTAAIYAAVILPLTVIAVILYAIDRVLIKRVNYFKLLLGEVIVLGLLYYVFFRM